MGHPPLSIHGAVHAGRFDEAGHPDPEPAAESFSLAGPGALLLRPPPGVGRSFERSFQKRGIVAAIVYRPAGALMRESLRAKEIPAPHHHRIQSRRPGDTVHELFGHERPERKSHPAIRPGRKLVGRDGKARVVVVGHPVRPGKRDPDRLRIERAGQRKGGVRSDVAERPCPEAREAAVRLRRRLRLDRHIPRVERRLQVLHPILDPLDGAAETHGKPGHHHLLRIELHLGTESAPDVRGDDPDPARRDPEAAGKAVPQQVGHLGGREEFERSVRPVESRRRPGSLHRHARNAGMAARDADPDRRAVEPLPLAGRPLGAEQHVRRRVLVHEGRALAVSRARIGGHRQRLVFDVDEGRRILGKISVARGDHRDDLPGVAHGLGRHGMPVGRPVQRRPARRHLRPDGSDRARELRPGHHRRHPGRTARLSHLDRSDPRVGPRASHERELEARPAARGRPKTAPARGGGGGARTYARCRTCGYRTAMLARGAGNGRDSTPWRKARWISE